jgi:hypothetical protein
MGYIDSRATSAQRPALIALGKALFQQGGPAWGERKWVPIVIVHEVKGNDLKLAIGDKGGFTAKVILGRDRKSPVVVENNTIWPIRRAIKAKSQLKFKEPSVGEIRGEGVNGNYGTFTFSAGSPESTTSR